MFDKLKQLWDSNERILVTYRERMLQALKQDDDVSAWLGLPELLKLQIFHRGVEVPEFVSVADALQKNTHLQIVGTPGSGKTTLLRYISASSALGNIGSTRNLPVSVPLSSYKFESLSVAVQEQFARVAESTLRPEELAKLSLQGRLLVLLDGLDESPAPVILRRHIQDFINQYPKSAVVVTTRATFKSELQGFAVAHVAPLSQAEIRHLALHLCSRYSIDSHKLWLALNSNLVLLSLAQNPLLLHAIVQVYRSQGQIPLRANSLVEKWLELQQWSIPEKIKTEADKFATDIASYLYKNDKTMFELSEIADWFEKQTSSKSSLEQILSTLCEQGILINAERAAYRFVHKFIQEYFASKAFEKFAADDFVKFLETASNRDRYLAISHFLVQSTSSDKIISQLLKSPKPEFQLHAANLLAEGAKTSPSIYTQTIRHLLDALDAKPTEFAMRACDALVRLNDHRVKAYCRTELSKETVGSWKSAYVAYILSMQGETDNKVLESLFKAARDDDPKIRLQALRALFATKLQTGLIFAIDRLKNEEDSTVIEEILTGLESIDDLPKRVPASIYSILLAELERRSEIEDDPSQERLLELVGKLARSKAVEKVV